MDLIDSAVFTTPVHYLRYSVAVASWTVGVISACEPLNPCSAIMTSLEELQEHARTMVIEARAILDASELERGKLPITRPPEIQSGAEEFGDEPSLWNAMWILHAEARNFQKYGNFERTNVIEAIAAVEKLL